MLTEQRLGVAVYCVECGEAVQGEASKFCSRCGAGLSTSVPSGGFVEAGLPPSDAPRPGVAGARIPFETPTAPSSGQTQRSVAYYWIPFWIGFAVFELAIAEPGTGLEHLPYWLVWMVLAIGGASVAGWPQLATRFSLLWSLGLLVAEFLNVFVLRAKTDWLGFIWLVGGGIFVIVQWVKRRQQT